MNVSCLFFINFSVLYFQHKNISILFYNMKDIILLIYLKMAKLKIKVHRLVAFIANTDNKICIDHLNNNRLDNTINNLCWCSLSENQMNRKINIDNSSGIKGVY